MRILMVALLVALSSAFCLADSTRTIRRSDGTTAGTIDRSSNSETFRNSDGEIVYTRDRDRDGSTWRNSDGELEWTEEEAKMSYPDSEYNAPIVNADGSVDDVTPVCVLCRWKLGGYLCKAFPDGIPPYFWRGKGNPDNCGNGYRFEHCN